jgi:hypothetical protein
MEGRGEEKEQSAQLAVKNGDKGKLPRDWQIDKETRSLDACKVLRLVKADTKIVSSLLNAHKPHFPR